MNIESEECKKNLNSDQQYIIKTIGDSADQTHETCYLVGGLVRDCLMGKKGDDLDFVCSDPEKIVQNLEETHPNEVQELYKKENTRFKSKIIRFNDQKIDIVVPRKESYTSNSIKPNIENGSFLDDVNRRDFTINALYLGTNETERFKIVDLTQRGLNDLKNHILDTPLNPDQTFLDDPSRMLRGARFSACKNMTITSRVKDSINKNKELLNKTVTREENGESKEVRLVPIELIAQEVQKGSKCNHYFETLHELNLLTEIIPEVEELNKIPQNPRFHKSNVLVHTLQTLPYIPENPDLKMAMLLHDIGKKETTEMINGEYRAHNHWKISEEKTKTILSRLKYPKEKVDKISKLVKNHHLLHNLVLDSKVTDKTLRGVIKDYHDILPDIEIMTKADILSDNPNSQEILEKTNELINRIHQLEQTNPNLNQFKLAINGHDVMEFGYRNEKVGQILKEVEKLVIDDELPNTKESILLYLKNKNQ